MLQKRLTALLILLLGAGVAWFVYSSEVSGSRPFQLGVDLVGGTQLLYTTDTSKVAAGDIKDSIDSLRRVIERRVNPFGVSEAKVEIVRGGLVGTGDYRLKVTLPHVTDVETAKAQIGATPVLEFKLIKTGFAETYIDENGNPNPDAFEDTGLSGRMLTHAAVGFDQLSRPMVLLTFNSEGQKKYDDLLRNFSDRNLATFLDGRLIEVAVINPEHSPVTGGGGGQISGGFSAESAKTLATNLNFGALPVPIQLINTRTIGSSIGQQELQSGVAAGIWGLVAVTLFMIFWYRLPGLLASIALLLYVVFVLALFQLLAINLTATGIAAFILSIGMAVDANILIFERTREELQGGKSAKEAIHDGFARAWPSIRDSNISSMITAVVLFYFGGTELIMGFALVFGLGVLVSMLTAITVSRTFLMALGMEAKSGFSRFLFGSGTAR